jgi:hypothetical protein
MKTLYCCGGLGDTIIFAGAAVYLAEKHGGLRFVCLREHFESVSSFFLGTQIEVIIHENIDIQKEILEDIIVTGGMIPVTAERSWAEEFYRQMDLPYEIRWDYCPIAKAVKFVPQYDWPKDVSFAHDDPNRGMQIQKFHKYPVKLGRVQNEGGSILQYARAIETAPQVHVIDSCFYHLIECLDPSGELYYHKYAKMFIPGWNNVPTRKPWLVIEDADLAAEATVRHGFFWDKLRYRQIFTAK